MTKSKNRGRTFRFNFNTVKQAVKFFNNSVAVSGKTKWLCIKTLSVTILV